LAVVSLPTVEPKVAPGLVRISPTQRFPWTSHPSWRIGVDIDDGFWMVQQTQDTAPFAVRIVVHDDAPDVDSGALSLALDAACVADDPPPPTPRSRS
jgi:hypothetical protein